MLQLLLPRNCELAVNSDTGQSSVTSLGSVLIWHLGCRPAFLVYLTFPPPPLPQKPSLLSTSLVHTLRESSISNGHCSREEVEVESRESVLQGGDGYEAVGHTSPDEGCRLPSVVAFHQATCFHGQSVYTLKNEKYLLMANSDSTCTITSAYTCKWLFRPL